MSVQHSLFAGLQEMEPTPTPRTRGQKTEPPAPSGSLWSASPQQLLDCPGNCRALRSSETCALDAARLTRSTGLRTQTGCSQCGGGALAVVTCLSPVTIRSRGGIPKKRPFQPWEEHDAWRMTVLQERVIGLDWRRRFLFLPGWRAVGRRE